MKHPINLNIKTPCQENFNNFTPTKDGGFCGSCQQEVIDFTTMNTEEIISYFKNRNTQNTCGRFKKSQLKSFSNNKHVKKKASLLTGIGLACLSLFSLNTSQAQEVKRNLDTKKTKKVNVLQTKKDITVKGNLKDENGIPLPSATILLEGTTIGTTTDFDGNFVFPEKLKKGDVLVFSYVGYESKKIIINNSKSATKVDLQVSMTADSCILMGKVAVKKPYKSKRN